MGNHRNQAGRAADSTRHTTQDAARSLTQQSAGYAPAGNYTLQQIPFALALHQGVHSSKGSPEHVHNQELEANRLLGFVHAELGVQTWAEFRNIHVKTYVNHLQDKGMTPSSIRNATNPIRLAAGWMLDNFDHPPVQVQRYLPKRREPVKAFLNASQLKQAYHTARRLERWQAAAIVLLCGWCALRLTEAMRLEPEDLRDDDILMIGVRGAKNPISVRALPIPAFVARELREFWHGRRRGRTRDFGPSRYAVSHQIREVFDAVFEETGDETFKRCAPKYLRRSLANMLQGKVDSDLTRAYYGHSQQDMFNRFYASLIPKVDDVESVQTAAIQRLRGSVVRQVDKLFRDISR